MSALVDLLRVSELAATEIAPGDSLLPHLLDNFAADARSTLEHMRAKAHVADKRLLAGDARRLRTGSASLGAFALTKALADIELGTRSDTSSELEARIARALEVLYATCDAILRNLPTIRNVPPSAP